jgi:hypothetical protein
MSETEKGEPVTAVSAPVELFKLKTEILPRKSPTKTNLDEGSTTTELGMLGAASGDPVISVRVPVDASMEYTETEPFPPPLMTNKNFPEASVAAWNGSDPA